MKHIFRHVCSFVILVSLFVTGVRDVSAVAVRPITSGDESHYYSVSIKEDGRATALLRVEGVGEGGNGGEYVFSLPNGWTGNVQAWYIDNGAFTKCIQPLIGQDTPAMGQPGVMNQRDAMYPSPPYPCWESVRTWTPVEAVQDADTVRILLPKTKGLATVGISWSMRDVTSRAWWGRKITVATPVVDRIVSYTHITVDFPDGVYIRDKSVGPSNWGDMQSGIVMSRSEAGSDKNMAVTPELFDRVSDGDVVKDKSNMMPGEHYTFTLLSATSRWKLFIPEITSMGAGVVLLIVVTALLLRLIVGRRPLWWYAAVVSLGMLFVGIILWLVMMSRSFLPRTDYPVGMMESRQMFPNVQKIELLDTPTATEGEAGSSAVGR